MSTERAVVPVAVEQEWAVSGVHVRSVESWQIQRWMSLQIFLLQETDEC